MPGIIRSLIAKPRMRKRPYSMLLDEDGSLTADFPARDGKATMLFLEKLRITRIDYVESVDELRKIIRPNPIDVADDEPADEPAVIGPVDRPGDESADDESAEEAE